MDNGLTEPLTSPAAKALIREILVTGVVAFVPHSLEAMKDDRLGKVDILSALRAGIVEHADFERGSWRYRVRSQRIVVVVAFRSSTQLRVVTVWRIR